MGRTRVRGWIVLLLSLLMIPGVADAQARRNGRASRNGQAQRGARGQQEVSPPAVAPANPWISELLEGYGWQAELAKLGPGPAPASLNAKFNEWLAKHRGPITGSVVAEFVPSAGGRNRSSRNSGLLNFETRGTLSDGAPYHVMVEVQASDVSNADAPASSAYAAGKQYVISGKTDGHPIGQDVPRAGGAAAKPGVALTLEFETATIRPYEPPKSPAAKSVPAKPTPTNANAPGSAKAAANAPMTDRPDVLILVHPSHRDWMPTLQEWAQPTQAYSFITTEDTKGIDSPPKVRVDAGTSPTTFKQWMYALVLDQLMDDEPTPLGEVSKLSYTLFYRASDKDKSITLMQGTISGIVTRGTPGAFLRGLIGGQIAHDIQVGLGEKIYGNGSGTPLITGDQRRHEVAHRVQISKHDGVDVATFPLENKLAVPISVTLTTSRLRQVPLGWTFDNVTASTDRVTLEPGEKLNLTIPVNEFDNVTPEAAVAYGTIIDGRVMAYEK